jgi:hypothetical protein
LSIPALGEQFFRHEYGRLFAMLSRRIGVQYVEAIEDAMQSALLAGRDGAPVISSAASNASRVWSRGTWPSM